MTPRLIAGAAAALACVAAAAIFALRPMPGPAPLAPPPSLPAPRPEAAAVSPPATAPTPVQQPAQATAPSFDVVRVTPQGNAVIAGRAQPGAEVIVLDGATEVARTRADRRGEFVALPPQPLPEGGRTLTLASRGPSGGEQRSDGAVVILVPPSAPRPAAVASVTTFGPPAAPAADAAPQAAVAVLVPAAGPPRVLQEPRRVNPVTLDVLDYTDQGGVRFNGAAAPGRPLRLYADNKPIGDATADASGRWSLAPDAAIPPGLHTLRVDELDPSGRVLSRIELPFQRAAPTVAEAPGRVIVQPGQSLWRLARGTYGSGARYTVIYQANREQIRDPNFIYPGQAFALPGNP